MDAITIAGAFATIVGLICNFKSEQRAVSDDEYKVFIEWLSERRHDQLIRFISSNNLLATGIKNLLQENADILIRKIDALDAILTKIASQIDGLSGIANAIKLNEEFSKQCVSILKQMNDSGASSIAELKISGGSLLTMLDGQGGNIEYNEPRFIEDDLRTLLELRMLRLSYGSSGTRIFHITREATRVLDVIDRK